MSNVASLANLRPPWRAGQSGNPGGKPAGARNRLQADFLGALADHFAEACVEGGKTKGVNAIERVWENHPVQYVRAIAQLMPRQLETAGLLDELDDADLRALVEIVKAAKQRRSERSATEHAS